MTRLKHYVIYGDPVPLARARLSRGRVYDAQKHLKLVWGLELGKLHNNEPFFKAPVFMDVIFYMPIAKNLSQRKREQIYGQWHSQRPDASNLLKFIEDIATTICYQDDCIIVKQNVEKVYDDGLGPRTEFMFQELQKRKPRSLNGKNS